MNRFLSLLLLLVCSFVGQAANPSFQNLLWTNVSGTIKASSQVADGASAVAFQIQSSNILTGVEGAFRTALQYINGPTQTATNRTFRVRPDGGLVLGSDADAAGVSDEAIGAIEIARNVANGDASGAEIYLENKSNSDYDIFAAFQGSVSVDPSNVDAALNLDAQEMGASTYRLSLRSKKDASEITMGVKFSGTQLTRLSPSRADGSTPYEFGTSLTHTNGNLVEVKNNGTNVFAIDYLGNLVGPSATVPVTVYNITIQTNLIVKGNANVNAHYANSGTYSNNLAVLGDLAVTGALTKGGVAVATYAGITNTITFALSDMTTALTTGTNKNYWYAPAAGMTIKWVRATVATSSSSGTPTFDINEAGTSILSTKITIDANEWDSDTAATPPVISDSAIAARAKVDFDIDVAGTDAAGAQIQVGYTVP